MNEKNFRQDLINALTGENAHISLSSALKNLKPENRNVQPSPDIHSVWQQLEHIRITQEDILQYMLDPNWKSPQWPDEYWPKKEKIIPEDKWNSSLTNLDNNLQQLAALIKDTKIDLTSAIPHAENHTYLREILLVIDHNSYHTAQIVQTRKALGDWEE